jgi:hypothetical protein
VRLRQLLRSRWARGLFLFMPTVVGDMVAAGMEEEEAGVEEEADTSAEVVRTLAAVAPGWVALGVLGWVALEVFEAAVWPRLGVSAG